MKFKIFNKTKSLTIFSAKKSFDLLNSLQLKKLWWYFFSSKLSIKFNASLFFNPSYDFNYDDYPSLVWRVIKNLYLVGNPVGLGLHTYYQADLSKWIWLTQKNLYLLKLLVWWDSWYFFGICISKWNNFLSSTLTIWNVFYKQIIEKTYFLFNIWNTLVSEISRKILKGNFLNYRSNHWAKFFFFWKFPRAKSVVLFWSLKN